MATRRQKAAALVGPLLITFVAGAAVLGPASTRLTRPEEGPRLAEGGAGAEHAPAAAVPITMAAGRPIPVVENPAELRALVQQCRDAGAEDADWLRAAALGSADPLVAGNAIQALGRLGLVVDDAALLALLAADPRPRVRQELVLALAAARGERARALLDGVENGADPELADLARSARAALHQAR